MKDTVTYVGMLPAKPGRGIHHPDPSCWMVRVYNYKPVPIWLAQQAGLRKCTIPGGCK